MSSAPAGQRGQAAAAVGPDRGSVPPAADVTADEPAGGWMGAAAKYAPVLAAAATMAVLGFWGLARGSAMGNDEVATRWAALLGLRHLAHLLNHVDAVHGLYYLLMHGWMAVGTSPAVMRIPSVISMIAAVAIVVVLGRRLTGSGWAGLFAGLIMALTPMISYWAQTARSNALTFTLVLVLTLVLLRALTAEAASETGLRLARWWLIYGALVALSGYLDEMSLLVLPAHAVTVLLARYGRRSVVRWAAASVGGAVLVTPLALIGAREDSAIAWIKRPDLRDVWALFHDYFGATTVIAVLILGCAIVAVLPPRGWWRGQRAGAARDGERPEPAWWSRGGISLQSVALPLLVLPAAVLILESLVARPFYVDRYVLYGEAGAALLAGAGLLRIGRWLGGVVADEGSRRVLIWLPGVLACACVLLLQIGPQHRTRTAGIRLFDFGGPAKYVAARARTGDGVLFFNAFYRKARLGYPDDYLKVTDFAMAVTPVRSGTFNGRDKPFGVTGPLMLRYRRIWVVGRSPYGHLDGSFAQEALVLRHSFSMIADQHFRGIVVTLWLRR